MKCFQMVGFHSLLSQKQFLMKDPHGGVCINNSPPTITLWSLLDMLNTCSPLAIKSLRRRLMLIIIGVSLAKYLLIFCLPLSCLPSKYCNHIFKVGEFEGLMTSFHSRVTGEVRVASDGQELYQLHPEVSASRVSVASRVVNPKHDELHPAVSKELYQLHRKIWVYKMSNNWKFLTQFYCTLLSTQLYAHIENY
jgi:hypothetical protein